jgi:hypothetical protein
MAYILRPKKVKYKLKEGTQIMCYLNHTECEQEEGMVELVEFNRHAGKVEIGRSTYVIERWRVRFLESQFVTHRLFRVIDYKI